MQFFPKFGQKKSRTSLFIKSLKIFWALHLETKPFIKRLSPIDQSILKIKRGYINFERLEFLGDTVIDTVVAHFLLQ